MERLAGSKALAAEVRILLQEVGKLRDEKRALQFEVSELLAMKARHSADGEYHPEWRPPHEPPAALAPPPPEPEAPSQELVLHQEAKSGWRALPKKHERKPREPRVPKAKMPEPPPPPAPAPVPQANIPSWASWRPNPIYHPQPRQAAVPAPPSGLFGPPSPPPR